MPRILNLFKTWVHAWLALAMVLVAYLGAPALGMLDTGPARIDYSFENFGDGGDRVARADVFLPISAIVPPEPADAQPTEESDIEAEAVEPAEGAEEPTDGSEAPKIDRTLQRPSPTALRLDRLEQRRLAVEAAVAQRESARGKRGKCAEPPDEVVQVSANHWRVDRDFVESYTTDMDRFNTLGVVNRHKDRSGRADGFQVGRISCGSPLHAGGVRNGDVVHSVNGHKTHNALQAIVAYQRLRKKDRIEVDLTRRDGARVTLVYSVI